MILRKKIVRVISIILHLLVVCNNLSYAEAQNTLSHDKALKIAAEANELYKKVCSIAEVVMNTSRIRQDNNSLSKLILEVKDLLLETKKFALSLAKSKEFASSVENIIKKYDYIEDTYNYYVYTKKDYYAALEIMPAFTELVQNLNSIITEKLEALDSSKSSYSVKSKNLSYDEALKLTAATKVCYKKTKAFSEKLHSLIKDKRDNASLNSLIQEANVLIRDAKKLVSIFSRFKYKDWFIENKLRHYELLEDSYYYYVNTEKNYLAALELIPSLVEILEGFYKAMNRISESMRSGDIIKLN